MDHFGEYLVSHDAISAPQLGLALESQHKASTNLSLLSAIEAVITPADLERIIAHHREHGGDFETTLFELKLLAPEEIQKLKVARAEFRIPLGEVLRHAGVLTAAQAHEWARRFQLDDTEDRAALPGLLRSLPAFEDLPESALALLISCFQSATCHPEEILYREGETADSMYVLEYGLLRVTLTQAGHTRDLGDLRKGDAIGMAALLGTSTQTETVQARSHTKVWRIKSSAFQSVLQDHPEIALRISRAVWKQLHSVVHALKDPGGSVKTRRANLRTIVLDLNADLDRNRAIVLAIVRAFRELPGQQGDIQVLYNLPELEFPLELPLDLPDAHQNDAPSRTKSSGRVFTLELPAVDTQTNSQAALTRLMSWLQVEGKHIEHILVFSFRPSAGDPERETVINFQRELVRNSDRSVVLTDLAHGCPALVSPGSPDRVRFYLLNRENAELNANGFTELKNLLPERFLAPILFHASPQTLPGAARSLAVGLFGTELGLALGGGGAKCGAHIGVLQVLEEAGIPVHVISGSSSGSVIGALWAAGYNATQIEELYTAAVLSRRWKFPQWTLPLRGSIARGKHGEKFLERTLGTARTYDAVRPFLPGAVDLKQGRDIVIRGAEMKAAVLASQAIPGFLPLVEYDGMQLADCALANNVPSSKLKGHGAGLIVGVNISPAPDQTQFDSHSIPSNLLRGVEVMMHQTTSRHLDFSDLEIRPDVGQFALTDFASTREYIRLGRYAMQENLPRLRRALSERFDSNPDQE